MDSLYNLFGKKQSVSPAATKLHEVITQMCAHPGRDSGIHAAPLYELLPTSKIPRDVADLFAKVTTFSVSFSLINAATGSATVNTDTTESMDALKKLCNIEGPIVNNLLHRIAKMADAKDTQTVSFLAMTGAGTTTTSRETTKVIRARFKSQRDMARAELTRRGSPKYDASHYVDG